MNPQQTTLMSTLRDRIRDGDYRPGVRIPSQAEMAEEFHVSGRTIAMVCGRNCRARGYLWTLPHKGSYARPSDHWDDPDAPE